MTFARSSAGVGNYIHFHKADLVVFCEGGGEEVVLEDEFDALESETIDALYWRKRLTREEGVSVVKAKSLGSKKNVLRLFERFKAQESRGVIFAVDSDYDRLLRRAESSPLVRYSYGYSIENDAISRDVIIRLTSRINPAASQSRIDRVATRSVGGLNKVLVQFKRYIYADLLLGCCGERGILDGRVGQYIQFDGGAVSFDFSRFRRWVANQVSEASRGKFRLCVNIEINPAEHMRGHALFELFARIFGRSYRDEFGAGVNVRNDVLKAWLVDCM